jgi:3-deoxy-7-phosphoheptulonate synthase
MHEQLLESPKALKMKLPLGLIEAEAIASWRREIRDIIEGRDPRILLIVGPCSIHNIESALHYAKLLKALADDVQDHFFVVMRTYFEKARTTLGWKGLIYDPHLDDSNDSRSGLHLARSFLLELVRLGLPAATEFLEPIVSNYIEDLISWGSIGARTAQSQIHRQLASSLSMPVGIKNRTDGNIDVAIQAAISARMQHSFLAMNDSGQAVIRKSKGNPLPHIVLRGGEECKNYDRASIDHAVKLLERAKITPHIIVDCAHDNSKKNYKKQTEIFSYLLDEVIGGNTAIRGIMLESFLLEASQDTLTSTTLSSEEIAYGASLTDPCLGWEETEALIKEAHKLKSYQYQVANT